MKFLFIQRLCKSNITLEVMFINQELLKLDLTDAKGLAWTVKTKM